jgi:hypothetical protein
MSTLTTTPVANLRQSRKETAAAKRAQQAPAKPAATPAKAPATKAPAKAAAKAPAKATPAAAKLRWAIEGERDSKGRAPATAGNYAITGSADVWRATVKAGNKTVVLVDGGSFGKCYNACVADNKSRNT